MVSHYVKIILFERERERERERFNKCVAPTMMVHMVLTITIMWCEIDESILEILFILFFLNSEKDF